MAIKLDSSGPIFYGSERVGRHGKRFRLLKFRTMRVGADQTGQVISTSDDPRQTRLGKFLRHWKLDELPNFVNVLKGDMSIVGPRPEAAKYVALYSPEEMRVLAVRPGITDSAVSSEYRDEQHILDRVEDPEEYYQQVILKDYLAMNLKYVDARPSLCAIWRSSRRPFARCCSAMPRRSTPRRTTCQPTKVGPGDPNARRSLSGPRGR